MNKSRPVYAPLGLDPAGKTHLLVSDLPEIQDNVALPGVESWVVRVVAPGIAAGADGHVRAFRAKADLLAHLAHRLGREAVGFRLYAAGGEAFLWDVHNIAQQAGLGADEIRLCHAGSLRRRVYCTHCKSMIEDVTTNIVTCPECKAALFVRDHFSRRLAAFMGVMVDAEMPGDIPAAETVFL